MVYKFNKIIRDPVHGYIHLNDLETGIINTKIFLRLQYIKQSPTAYLTYPSHHVNRFVHSLGTMELASKMVFHALENSDPGVVESFLNECAQGFDIDYEKVKNYLVQVVRLAALLHDVGHPPFSHLGESALTKDDILKLYGDEDDFQKFAKDNGGKMPKFHEFATYCLVRDDNELERLLAKNNNYKITLLKIFGPKPEGIFATIREIISSDIDADRADFVIRDGMTSGIGFGEYDVMRLVESMVLWCSPKKNHFSIVPTTSALSTVEALLIERYKMYKWLYYHPHVILTDTALSYLIRKLLEWTKDYNHPLGNLLRIDNFHHKNYIKDERPFDDQEVMLKLRQGFDICRKFTSQGGQWQEDIDLAYTLFRLVLFREKFAKAVFKNISEYKSFDMELKQKMTEGKVAFSDQLPDEPVLNNYAKRIAGTVPLKEDMRFDKILATNDQFVLETERALFETYSFELSERKRPVVGGTKVLVESEYKSKCFLIERKTDKPLFISELSQTVQQLLQAWRNDMQLFLYIVRFKKPEKGEWPAIIEESRTKIKDQISTLWHEDLLRQNQL